MRFYLENKMYECDNGETFILANDELYSIDTNKNKHLLIKNLDDTYEINYIPKYQKFVIIEDGTRCDFVYIYSLQTILNLNKSIDIREEKYIVSFPWNNCYCLNDDFIFCLHDDGIFSLNINTT